MPAAILLTAPLLCASAAADGTPLVEKSSCGAARIESRNAPLRDVLEAASQSLDFQLNYEAAENPAVALAGTYSATELIEEISRKANVLARYRFSAAPNCRRRLQIAQVWVLRTGQAQPVARAAPSTPLPATPVAPRPEAESPVDQFMRAHGFTPAASAPSGD